jgi:hypothetical protein
MIASEDPRFSGGNAAAPSCVDMNRRLVSRPRAARTPGPVPPCGAEPSRGLGNDQRVAGEEGSRGPRHRAGWRRKTSAWTGFGLTI